MPLTIQDFKKLHQYINGVMERVAHHAPNVNDVALSIAGAVIWKATEDIKVMASGGATKNVLWFNVGNRRYALSYVHNNGTIELREGSLQGRVIQAFDNNTSISTIRQTFESL